MVVNSICRWFWTKVAEWKYRKQEYNAVCCCGNSMKKMVPEDEGYFGDPYFPKEWHGCPDFYCDHPSRCAKEYAVTSYVEEKMK